MRGKREVRWKGEVAQENKLLLLIEKGNRDLEQMEAGISF